MLKFSDAAKLEKDSSFYIIVTEEGLPKLVEYKFLAHPDHPHDKNKKCDFFRATEVKMKEYEIIPSHMFGEKAFLDENLAKKYIVNLAIKLIEKKKDEIEKLQKIVIYTHYIAESND